MTIDWSGAFPASPNRTRREISRTRPDSLEEHGTITVLYNALFSRDVVGPSGIIPWLSSPPSPELVSQSSLRPAVAARATRRIIES